MELKDYQKNVIEDLDSYLQYLSVTESISEAYKRVWADKDVVVDDNGILPAYQNSIKNTPHVCIKVPTGGGKTFIATCSIKYIYETLRIRQNKAVVWLVPTDSILKQTLNNLQNPNHPYRKQLVKDFQGKVEVYSKEQLLMGENFSPTIIEDQLSVFILSYDSFRGRSADTLRAFRDNGQLLSFDTLLRGENIELIDTAAETSLIQVIRTLNPVVIVDESHHATSLLSKKMLENFNPSFILELTATPKTTSNIISIVSAHQLKKEHMVKLPVVVYNRNKPQDVIFDAIVLQKKLELTAKEDEENGGKYIRPIVLFQAEPKNDEDSVTFEKIKKKLIELDIPEETIAIKTAKIDEIQNVDLLSRNCPVRYIITINALKEGWDCPFAFVLATIANKTSVIDVEQILGRVLRLPYARESESAVLNLSYVITSSSDFQTTLNNVVKGLNSAGFSKKDARVAKFEEPDQLEKPKNSGSDDEKEEPKTSSQHLETNENDAYYETEKKDEDNNTNDSESAIEELVDSETTEIMKKQIQEALDNLDKGQTSPETSSIDQLMKTAEKESDNYQKKIANNDEPSQSSDEAKSNLKEFPMSGEFEAEAKELKLPQFLVEQQNIGLFSGELDYELLDLQALNEGFKLSNRGSSINFSAVKSSMAQVDVSLSSDVPKVTLIAERERDELRKFMSQHPREIQISTAKDIIVKYLNRINEVAKSELQAYVERVMNELSDEQLDDLLDNPYPYGEKIRERINSYLSEYRKEQFDQWLDSDKIIVKPNWKFAEEIRLTSIEDIFPKSLYEAEDGKMNNFERKMVLELASAPNIKWWHRNISQRGYLINGYVRTYPDLIAYTTKGKTLLIETKGDYLDNKDSRNKTNVGRALASRSQGDCKYFMVFENEKPAYDGSYNYDEFIKLLLDF